MFSDSLKNEASFLFFNREVEKRGKGSYNKMIHCDIVVDNFSHKKE